MGGVVAGFAASVRCFLLVDVALSSRQLGVGLSAPSLMDLRQRSLVAANKASRHTLVFAEVSCYWASAASAAASMRETRLNYNSRFFMR